jgi:hypothetical protein
MEQTTQQKKPQKLLEINKKIYPPYVQVMFKFRSLGERVFKPFSQTRYKMIIAK